MRLSGRGVRCVRGGREVFSGLDFDASTGEALAVTGSNGSGKTSLLRLIAGLLTISGGSIGLEGGETEQALSRANVQDGVTRLDLRPIEDAVANGREPGEVDGAHPVAPAVAAGTEPGGPDVGVRHGAWERARSFPRSLRLPEGDALRRLRRAAGSDR